MLLAHCKIAYGLQIRLRTLPLGKSMCIDGASSYYISDFHPRSMKNCYYLVNVRICCLGLEVEKRTKELNVQTLDILAFSFIILSDILRKPRKVCKNVETVQVIYKSQYTINVVFTTFSLYQISFKSLWCSVSSTSLSL